MGDRLVTPPGFMLVSDADYGLLIELASASDMLVICEVCGAWMYRADDACAVVNDFTGCWKAATGGKIDLCMSHRAPNPAAPSPTTPASIRKEGRADG